jgi:hypothetical protein
LLCYRIGTLKQQYGWDGTRFDDLDVTCAL